jgi:hypothetical protein
MKDNEGSMLVGAHVSTVYYLKLLYLFTQLPIEEKLVCIMYLLMYVVQVGLSKSFRTGLLEQALEMVQLSATRYSCVAIL